jgi:hypothetical protein
MSRGLPIGENKPCYRDCLIFLLPGEFIIKGQGRVIETGCAYRVKDETWLWLCGTTARVVMGEGEQRGECLRCKQESRELILASKDRSRKVRKGARKLVGEKVTGTSIFGTASPTVVVVLLGIASRLFVFSVLFSS